MWLKISKKLTNYMSDLYLYCTYVSPKSSCRFRGEDVSKLDMIYNDVVKFRALGLVTIMGDLNCRKENMKDYIDNENDHSIIMDLPEPINNILDVCDVPLNFIFVWFANQLTAVHL